LDPATRQEDDVKDLEGSELIVAVAEPAGLILFLLALGWAAVERGSVHAYVRREWRSGSRAAGRDWVSVFDDVLRRARPGAAGRAHHLKEHSGWPSHR
jgi:hypothetical protein